MNTSFKKIGDNTLLIQWSEEKPLEITAARDLIEENYSKEIIETVPAYKELAIYLHYRTDSAALLKRLEPDIGKLDEERQKQKEKIYQIPVCYHPEMGEDLESLAKEKGLTVKELIGLHTKPNYRINFLGFLPGFPYLSGLRKELHHPRLKTPRQRILAGSVGIAGNQTGIYPQASPGGWNLIGRSPLRLFDPNQEPPALLKAMNRLHFYPIDRSEFKSIEKAVEKGEYQIEFSHD